MSRCGTCNVVLNGGDNLQQHYNSETHLNNVRRRVEGLRPLTAQEMRRQAQEEGMAMDPSGAPIFSCTLCKKTFHSVQTLQTHVRSTAHLMRKEQGIVARDSEAASMLTMTSLGSAAMGLHRRHKAKRSALKNASAGPKAPKVSPKDRDEDVSVTRCFFCGQPSETMELNVMHMRKYHQFYIPMENRCKDVEGLLAYASRKVNGLMCLVCNERTRSFPSLDALRDHMREVDHEKIVLGPEYEEFYECALEDPLAIEKVEMAGAQATEVVLSSDSGKKRVLKMREVDAPRSRLRETTEETERRRAILAAETECLALVKQEQKELRASQDQEQQKMLKRQGTEFKHHQLKVNLRSNKLHPKGYDGEGLLN